MRVSSDSLAVFAALYTLALLLVVTFLIEPCPPCHVVMNETLPSRDVVLYLYQ